MRQVDEETEESAAILAPVMDRALAFVGERLPASADVLEAELRERGWTRVGMPLENLATGAKLLGRRADFRVVRIDTDQKDSPRLAVRAEAVDAVLAIVDAAKKAIYFHGLATVGRIERLVAARFPDCVGPELVRANPAAGRRLRVARRSLGLVPHPGHRPAWPAQDDRQSAGGRRRVSVGQLRAAMGRNRRMWKAPPPEKVLLEFCRDMPACKIEGQRIIADPPRDWREALTGVELKLVRVLTEHGPVMERGQMEDICVRDGMNRFSFHAFVSWSPVIVQLGHSMYGRAGGRGVAAAEIDALLAARRARPFGRTVLDSHGWTDDGKVWLRYRLVEGGQHLRGHHRAGGA